MADPDSAQATDQKPGAKHHDAPHKRNSHPPDAKTTAPASSTSIQQLQAFVADTKVQVDSLAGGALDGSFQVSVAGGSVTKVIADVAGHIASGMPAVTSALQADQGEVEKVGALLSALDHALNTLFVIARRHHVPLRGGKLERVFDGEDEMRRVVSELPMGRSDAYYDEAVPATAGSPMQPAGAPSMDDLNAGQRTDEKPNNRGQLLALVGNFGAKVAESMHTGMSDAEGLINSPDAPENPSMLEVLAEAAIDFAFNAATGGLSAFVKNMMKMPHTASVSLKDQAAQEFGGAHGGGAHGGGTHEGGAHEGGTAVAPPAPTHTPSGPMEKHESEEFEDEDMGKLMIDKLGDALKDAGKGAIKPGLKVLTNGGGGEGEKKEGDVNSKLTFKELYFQVARARTSALTGNVIDNYAMAVAGSLKRVPVSALEGLIAAFTPNVVQHIKETVTNDIISGWIRFAADSGQYGGDPSKKPSGNPSALDATPGVVEIYMSANPDGSAMAFQDASISYLQGSVLENLQKQEGTLADVPLARTIRCFGLGFVPFDVDHRGFINVASIRSLPVDQQINLANLSRASEREGSGLESAALAGAYKVLSFLSGVPRSQIKNGRSA